ncbi:MAG TPA: NAD(P)-dependent alcohol dehydrogenase, partial [Pyrinomonadaceae bacterium]|nr:NAD(P)-dependent alcohol dehydrogenase [Pyrinomonadaceae bacterium]
YHEYGSADVLKCEEVEKPVPKDDEVLINVRAASVNPLDWRLMEGNPRFLRLFLGLRKPKSGRPGVDVAGEIEAVGSKVTQFKPGDAVFGACSGAFAEYACTAESKIAMKPDSLTFDQAASVNVAGLTALQGLRDKGKIQPGSKVLINGAAGGVGTFAVQIAKSFYAHVTGVCSTRNIEMVRSIGADEVIDYTRHDFTTSDQRYDLILDCVGNHSFSECRRVLNPNGRLVGIGAPHDASMMAVLASITKDQVLSVFGSQKAVMFIAKASQEDLKLLAELITSGKLKPVIDRRYGWSEAPDAVRHVEEGHARGKVIIQVSADFADYAEQQAERSGQ